MGASSLGWADITLTGHGTRSLWVLYYILTCNTLQFWPSAGESALVASCLISSLRREFGSPYLGKM